MAKPFSALSEYLDEVPVSDQSDVYGSEGLGPIESWSDDLVVMAAGQGRPEAIAEREKRIRGVSRPGLNQTATRALLEKATKRVGDFVAEQERIPSPSAGSLRPLFGLSPVGKQEASAASTGSRSQEGIPSSLRRSDSDWVTARAPTGPFFRPTPEAYLPPESLRATEQLQKTAPVALPEGALSLEPDAVAVQEEDRDPAVYAEANMLPPLSEEQQARPLSQAAFAAETERARRRMAKDAASVSTPIPVNLASPRSDTAPVKSEAIAPSGPTTPAPPADTAAKTGLPVPQTGAGGDAMDRLGLGEAFVRALEGSGSIIAGRDLRSGAAETLAERMKQIEALRAKREEQGLEQQRERATWGASNRSTLASALAQWKGDEAKTAALEALAAGADTTKPSDFSRNVVNAVMTKPKVLGAEAAGALAGERAETAKQKRSGEVGLVENKVRSEQERTKLLREQAGLTAAKAEALRAEKEKGALIKEAGPSKGPFSDPKLELRRKAAFIKETTAAGKLYTEPTQQLASLERESGDLIEGRTPAWWNPANVVLLQKGVTSGLPEDALKFAKKYYAVINPLRHGLFGSALTDGEQKAFADQIEIALLRGPRDLGMALKELMSMQRDKTKLRLGFILNDAPDLAEAWLKTSGFLDSIKGTSFEGMFPQAPPAAPAATDNATVSAPSARSVDALKKDPSTLNRQYFDEQFGPGAAKKALGE